MLLEANADIALKDKLGRTALHIAIESKSYSVAELLVENMTKAELNAMDNVCDELN
jgi:ankyrin repeat protein